MALQVLKNPLLTKIVSKRWYPCGIEKQFNNPIFKMWSANYCVKSKMPSDKVYISTSNNCVFCHPQIASILEKEFYNESIYFKNG